MPSPARPVVGFMILLTTALLGAPAVLAAPAGAIVGLSGSCSVESGGGRAVARMGQQLQVGDTVDVPADGKMKIRLADGSVISVASGSRMTVASLTVDGAGQRQEAKLSLGQGLLRAVVAPTQRPAAFEVDTAIGTAAVRSTDWFVEANPTGMRVGVLTGSVAMTSAATRRSVTIPARFGARMPAGGDPATPREWPQADFDTVISRTSVP